MNKTINVPVVKKVDLSSAIMMTVILVLVNCVLIILPHLIANRLDCLMMVLKTVYIDALSLDVAFEMLDYAVEHQSISRAQAR